MVLLRLKTTVDITTEYKTLTCHTTEAVQKDNTQILN